MSKQIIIISGHITGDAEVKVLPNQRQVINFSVAVNESYKDKNNVRIERTTFYTVERFLGEKSSTKIAKYLLKGSLVSVMGVPRINAYNSKDGTAKGELKIEARDINLLSSPKNKANDSESSEDYSNKEKEFESQSSN